MHDIDVRKPLREDLQEEFRHNSVILDEMVIPGRDARIDIAVVNGELHGFEIKSDSDNLQRLPAQRDAYGLLFDRVTVVCGAKHIEQVRKTVPCWWGIRLAVNRGSGVEIVPERKPASNPGIQIGSVVGLLRREEVEDLLRLHGILSGCRKYYIYELTELLIKRVASDCLMKSVRSYLKKRQGWRPDALRT